jgi:hypothetical protein
MAITAWFGDTHGNLKLMWDIAVKWQERTGIAIDWIFQVGDFGIWPAMDRMDPQTVSHAERHGYPLKEAFGDFQEVFLGGYEIPIPTYFIRGNHEDQEFLMTFERQLMQERPEDYLDHFVEICPNLRYVPDGHIITLNNVRIAGWGGCWGKNTWDMGYWSAERAAQNKNGYAKRLNHMTRDRFERLMRERFDVLVTHDAPVGSGVQGMPNPKKSLIDPETMSEDNPDGKGVPYIRELIEAVAPKYHFNGHWHEPRKNTFAAGKTTSVVLDKVHPDGKDRSCMEIIEL